MGRCYGLWTDPVTGIAYARARWYDARNASWLSEDPLGTVDSPNLYAFVGHAPNMGVDPLGLERDLWTSAERKAQQEAAAAARKAAAEQRAREEAQWNAFLDTQRAEFARIQGRQPTANDVIFSNLEANVMVRGSGRIDPVEGAVGGHLETLAMTFAVPAGKGVQLAMRTAQLTGRSAARAAVLSLVDDTAGEVLGLNPSVVRSLPRILESKGARVAANGDVVGRARTDRAVNTSVRASIGESEGYKEALRRGEIGLQRPGHANAPGVDFVTAVQDPITGQYRIVVTDVKTSTLGNFPPAATSLPAAWRQEALAAVGRLDLGDPMMEAQIRNAASGGNIAGRQLNADYSPAGQGRISGW